ncbi:DUF262 domain-containing protein [Pedobacter sp. Leaf132]|uniref:DUF262 domain-containing protein n=1 Tax=Pedobacter sp. Leaf132 TaxID=2876557 RepID=UPI001E3A19B0|nr:DUF262 domain-containing protein [Pedobacter sp. Leaf132]
MTTIPTTQDTQLVSSISADKLAVKDIFSDNYLFTIPNYQRPYSWEEEHCTQLLDDLHTFAFKDEPFDELPPYFLGSAVIIKREHIRNAQIVDGQQRLTTLTILLSCLRFAIADRGHKETISEFIFQKGNKLKGTSATYRLRTRTRDQEFFNALIQEENGLANYFAKPDQIGIKNDAQSQMMMNAKALLDEFKRKNYTQDQLELMVTYIIQKCVIVMVASTDEDMAFRIFNVLNDRGKDLTIADILKSEVLEKIEEEDQSTYTEKWEDCETKLGSNHFKNFFGYLRAIYAKKKAEKSVITEIREYVKPTENPKSFVDNVLIPFTNAYHHILQVDYKAIEHAEIINGQFRKLKRVGHTDWIPSAIFFMARHVNAPDKVKDFLLQLERTTLGMEAMKTSLNERLERYAKINTRIENCTDLYIGGSELMLSSADRTYIIASLRSPDLYGKRLVKPILARIEEEMNDHSITIHYGGLNIEHILPQTPIDHYWNSRFTTDEKLKFTNSLGNLSLITVRKNSQAKNYDFAKKINTYFREDGKASNLAMVNRLLDYSEWKGEYIEKRNTVLINLLLRSFGLPEIIADVQKSS